MQYQSFPDVKGGSNSLDKLSALRLPPLAGKSFLDVGCNEGFFCGFALFEGASHIVGLDRSAQAIRRATARFPGVSFVQSSWDTLPEGQFDIITLLSALHYAEDQEALIHALMGKLTETGVLVLEIGMAPGTENAWVSVKRSIDERVFPTRAKLGSVLAKYAWKVMGHSVNQAGDPLQRYVVHVRHKQPFVYLLLDDPGSGKTTLARHLFAPRKIPVVSGDKIYQRIATGQLKGVPSGIQELVEREFTTARIDKVTRQLFDAGFAADLVALWTRQVKYRDFALDTYVPEEWRPVVAEEFQILGFYPVAMNLPTKPLPPARTSIVRAKEYHEFLTKHAPAPQGPTVVIHRSKPAKNTPPLRWHLDSPQDGERMDDSDGQLRVSGWLVSTTEPQGAITIRLITANKEVACRPLSRKRPDVLKAVFGATEAAPAYWQEKPCGFQLQASVEQLRQGLALYAEVDGENFELARLELNTASQQGKNREPGNTGPFSKAGVPGIQEWWNKLRGS